MPEPQPELKRVLNLLDATCVVIGAIVGVGIFFNPKTVASIAGNERLALSIWVLGGVVALLGALTFAALGRLYPKVGGQYDILRDAWGAPVAFLYVFCNLTAIQAGAAAVIAIICANNLGVVMTGSAPSAHTTMAVAITLIAGLSSANLVGVRSGSTIQNVTVFAKLATLLAVMALAAFTSGAQPASTAAALPARIEGGVLNTLFAGLIPAMFSYGGWQQALWMGGEVKDARRN
ncbi:MAG: amino acid permease, partial [Planctomycetota bacterium]